MNRLAARHTGQDAPEELMWECEGRHDAAASGRGLARQDDRSWSSQGAAEHTCCRSEGSRAACLGAEVRMESIARGCRSGWAGR